MSRAHWLADDPHPVCAAVVCTEVRIFGNAPAELRVDDHDDAIGDSKALEIANEPVQSIACVAEQPAMERRLLNVCVEGVVAERDVVQLSWQTGCDTCRYLGQVHRCDAVVDVCLVVPPGGADGLGRGARSSVHGAKKSAIAWRSGQRTHGQFRRLRRHPALALKALGVVEHDGRMRGAAHDQWLLRGDADEHAVVRLRPHGVCGPAKPAIGASAVRRPGLPVGERRKV